MEDNMDNNNKKLNVLALIALIIAGVSSILAILGTAFTCSCSASKTWSKDNLKNILTAGQLEHKMSLVWILSLVAAIVAVAAVVIAIIIGILANPTPPIVIDPDHPLPDPDPNVTPIEGEDEEQMTSEEGGGAVSMIYTMKADYTLGSDWVEIYFKNPKRSNHDVAIELYVVSEGAEYLLGTSGRVAAGNALYRVTVSQDAPELSEGVYTGLYRVRYYNSLTGEKALVESDIVDIQITVTQ
jgi:hypothetical protein